MEKYQLLAPIVAIFYLLKTWKSFRSNRGFILTSLVWSVFWCLISFMAISPDGLSAKLAYIFGFQSNVNAVLFLFIGFLYLVIFYMTTYIEKMENQITTLVREIAIQNPKRKSI